MWRAGRLLASLVGVAFVATPAWAPPINTNVALPLAQGELVWRTQLRFLGKSDDPSPMAREIDVLAVPQVLVYGLSGRTALFGVFPYLDKELSLTAPDGTRVTRGDTGLGDSRIFARHDVYRGDQPGLVRRLAVIGGVKLPTGEDNARDALGPLPPTLQLGSGSLDYLVGAVYTHQTLREQFDVDFIYQLTNGANGFTFGNRLQFDVAYSRRLRPRTLGAGVPNVLYGILELNAFVAQRNRAQGTTVMDSGGWEVFLSPGLQRVSRRDVLEVSVMVPVARDLNGAQPRSDPTIVLSFRRNF